MLELVRLQPDLLAQLTTGRGGPLLAVDISCSRRELQDEGVERSPVLANEHHLRAADVVAVDQGHHRHRPRVTHDLTLHRRAVGGRDLGHDHGQLPTRWRTRSPTRRKPDLPETHRRSPGDAGSGVDGCSNGTAASTGKRWGALSSARRRAAATNSANSGADGWDGS
ncbi:MAG: hypothetical protein WKF43_17335 [Acidimicrobiales bacterium]